MTRRPTARGTRCSASRRQAESHSCDRIVEDLLDRDADLVDQAILRSKIGRPFAAVLDLAGRVDDSCKDLRPTDIDPDYAPISHCGAEGMQLQPPASLP